MRYNFTKEEKKELKSTYAEERKAIRAGGDDLNRIRQELAETRQAIIDAASERGPKQPTKNAAAAARKARSEKHTARRTPGHKPNLIRPNAGALTLPGVVVNR